MRPNRFSSFNGQVQVVSNLSLAVTACKLRNKQLGHILLVGPAGLGKTTLGMSVIPTELGVGARTINCAAIQKSTDLTAVLATVQKGEVLFLDELHALPPCAREHLLTAMEDGTICVKVGEGADENVLTVRLNAFTVIAATTRMGMLDAPLLSRFQMTFRLEPYTTSEMVQVLRWHCECDEFRGLTSFDDDCLSCLATAAKGVARNGVNLLQATLDTHVVECANPQEEPANHHTATRTLARLGFIDGLFNPLEWRYITFFVERENLRCGLGAVAAALDEQVSTVEDVYEPWLLRAGYVTRHSTGRTLSPHFYNKLLQRKAGV